MGISPPILLRTLLLLDIAVADGISRPRPVTVGPI